MSDAGPQPYPRVPHLVGSTSVSRNDLVLTKLESEHFFTRPVRVEEKLDGANVTLWLDPKAGIRVASRGGPQAVDRAGQLGPLRAWAARQDALLRPLLRSHAALYGEWLWFTHGVYYERLPEPFVGVDVRSRDGEFVSVRERDDLFAGARVLRPPQIFKGVLESVERLTALLDVSCFGSEAAEGLIVRSLEPSGGAPRLAKLVAQSFRRREDDAWRGPLGRNRVLAS
jgi:hypothetical protein